MKQIIGRILTNKEIAPDIYRMAIANDHLARSSLPGQFVEVRVSQGNAPLLRRPLGVHRVIPGGIEVLYKAVGEGTGLLAEKRSGQKIDIIGPLGHGFTIPAYKNGQVILVAGGMGVAPLVFLGQRLAKNGSHNITVLIGGCTKEHILCENDFKKCGCRVIVTTDDGSKGRKGLVTTALAGLRSMIAGYQVSIYACGPLGMLKAVHSLSAQHNVRLEVSLEERMACGVGVCLGCAVKVRTSGQRRSASDGYKMVCKDGPVFSADEIVW